MRTKLFTIVLLVATLLAFPALVSAQDTAPLPIYIVQPGDTLTVIAYRFGVHIDDLIAVNGITDPSAIGAGTQLAIPGLEGVQGVLTTQIVPLGESLISISRRHQFPQDKLIQLNHITSPTEIYAGASVIIPQQENSTFAGMAILKPGETALELSARQGLNPWTVSEINTLGNTLSALPDERLYFSDPDAQSDATTISPLLTGLEINPLPVVQGGTAVIHIRSAVPLEIGGELNAMPLHFFPTTTNEYVAIQGLHAMAETGLISFSLNGQAADGERFDFSQNILLAPGYYAQDPPLFVDPATIDPANTKPEDDLVRAAVAPATPDKLWTGIFIQPVDEPSCIKSWYGNRRSYNDGGYNYFHTGVDYGVCANLNIYSPAAGTVVFAGPLTVRGNATIIDHGWGIYSGIWHQASIAVQVGDQVEAGQLIGEIGGTGRVTGPHLHWELWANGVQVEPLDWLDNEYPSSPILQ